MKVRGGYNVPIKGKPATELRKLGDPSVLHLPLCSSRLNFSEVAVDDGAEVKQGDVLARDTGNHSVPLLAPRAGVARLEKVAGHVTLENVKADPDKGAAGEPGKGREALVALGAWQHISDVRTGGVADPSAEPQAVIVSVFGMEPFTASADVVLKDRLDDFGKGLENLRSLLGNAPAYFVFPRAGFTCLAQVRQLVGTMSWVKAVDVSGRYPMGEPGVVARMCDLDVSSKARPVWALGAQGVLAIHQALSLGRLSAERVVSIGGPAAKKAEHVQVVSGYPLEELLSDYRGSGEVRVVAGGAFTGRSVGEEHCGLDTECTGLTLIEEKTKRDFLGFARVGVAQNSYSRSFLSAIIPGFREKATTGIRGEGRPCVSCGFCEEVCPVPIMPYLIHRYASKGRLDEAEKYGLGLCVNCGLCSYVCPSKIDVATGLLEAQRAVAGELISEEERS